MTKIASFTSRRALVLAVLATAAGGPCTAVTLTATHARRGRALVVASRHAHIAAGHTQTFTLTLNPAGRSLLSQARRTHVVITVTAGTSHRLRAGTVGI